MKFTFGIITADTSNNQLKDVIQSIIEQNIPIFEIIIIGGIDQEYFYDSPIRHFEFEEVSKPWITKKKNLITQHALYENIVYLHDYVILCKGWYQGWLEMKDFSVANNIILNQDNSRFRDLTLVPWELKFPNSFPIFISDQKYLIPYKEKYLKKFNRWIYFSGAYFVAKKEVMLKEPLDEKLFWGDGEDIEWANRITKKFELSFNFTSKCKLLKQKDLVLKEISSLHLEFYSTIHAKKLKTKLQ